LSSLPARDTHISVPFPSKAREKGLGVRFLPPIRNIAKL
jgi:hypothetical protein